MERPIVAIVVGVLVLLTPTVLCLRRLHGQVDDAAGAFLDLALGSEWGDVDEDRFDEACEIWLEERRRHLGPSSLLPAVAAFGLSLFAVASVAVLLLLGGRPTGASLIAGAAVTVLLGPILFLHIFRHRLARAQAEAAVRVSGFAEAGTLFVPDDFYR